MPKRKGTRSFGGRQRSKSLKRPDIYDALRRKGMSKEASARISNAVAGRSRRGRRKKK